MGILEPQGFTCQGLGLRVQEVVFTDEVGLRNIPKPSAETPRPTDGSYVWG